MVYGLWRLPFTLTGADTVGLGYRHSAASSRAGGGWSIDGPVLVVNLVSLLSWIVG